MYFFESIGLLGHKRKGNECLTNHFFTSDPGRPQEVVIFVVGGTTYEEARSVALQNSTNSGTRIILGGSAVLNSKRFVTDSFFML